jgi:hypothetical protein
MILRKGGEEQVVMIHEKTFAPVRFRSAGADDAHSSHHRSLRLVKIRKDAIY